MVKQKKEILITTMTTFLGNFEAPICYEDNKCTISGNNNKTVNGDSIRN